jgi:hypothetical protein
MSFHVSEILFAVSTRTESCTLLITCFNCVDRNLYVRCSRVRLATLPHLQPVLNSLLSYLHIQKEKAPLVLVSHQPFVGVSSLMSQVVESELPRVYAHNVELELHARATHA